ncbi:MAG: MBL fold metallo-hydrolase RNA specificity domain-containing protein [Candidatus Magasanikbacteria bacterium]
MELTFYGGVGSVTGANYLLESQGRKLLVECGLVQGSGSSEEVNFKPFPYDPADVDYALVTHAHVDHTGRLPKLVSDGFEGVVVSTEPTREFSRYLLEDSMNLLCNSSDTVEGKSFCNKDNLQNLFKFWEVRDFHEPFNLGPFEVEFFRAGHILGSSFISVSSAGKSVVFSGDLGNSPAPLLRQREDMSELQPDVCLVESAYGGRIHESEKQAKDKLRGVIKKTMNAGGTLLVPSFAMERTQDLLFHIHKLIHENETPKVPIFLDSPLAIDLTDVYEEYIDYLNQEARHFVEEDGSFLEFPQLTKTYDSQASRNINNISKPKVIIAGSGMSQGGRIIHHEKRYLPDSDSTILFVGYQVEGSLGRAILDGADSVKILGDEVPVNARVESMESYSAYADKPQLLNWVSSSRNSLKSVFVVQGEKGQSKELAEEIKKEFGVKAGVPNFGESKHIK